MPKGNVNEAAEFIRVVWQVDRAEFGEFLRQKRQRLGYSQIAMARKIGVNQSQVSRIEKAETTPQSYQIALAFAQCYNLTKQETEEWLQLFGMSKYQAVEIEYGRWLVSVEALVQQIGGLFHIAQQDVAYDYFAPLTHAYNFAKLDASWDELCFAIDRLVGEQTGIYGDYLLVEFGRSTTHYLDARGDYARRIALAQHAARAAEKLERKTVLGWLLGDTIPYTLIQQCNDPLGARSYLAQGHSIARKIQNDELLALIDAYFAWTDLILGDARAAQSRIKQAQSLACSPIVQGRIHRIAGEIAWVSGEYQEALTHYNQAVLAVAPFSTRPGVTELKRGQCYLALQELSQAEMIFTNALSEMERHGTPPYESCLAKLGMSRIAHIKGETAEARAFATDAEALLHRLQIPDASKQVVRSFGANIP